MSESTGDNIEDRKQQAKLWSRSDREDYHRRQFEHPYRSTIKLGEFVRAVLPDCDRSLRAIDVGCGAGANMYHLSRILPNTSWVGLDLAMSLFSIGRKAVNDQALERRMQFVAGDFYRLGQTFRRRSFDLLFSIQTLSWIPDYEAILPQFFDILAPGGTFFVTSLFTDCLVEAKIQVFEYEEDDQCAGNGPHYYNIYSFERFKSRCFELGARDVVGVDFAIDVDLPPPPHRRMGTYTRILQDGARLQCSGPLLLPWKFVAILL